MKLHAIITGDLVASRKASTQNVGDAMTALQKGADSFGHKWDCAPKFTRFRGDGWQIHVANPAAVLDGIILLLAQLRAANTGIATRAAIAIGPIEALGTRDLSDGNGTAFFLSGDLLENMDKHSRIQIAGQGVTKWHKAVIDLLDFQISGWTAAQAQAVALSLTPGYERHEDIANHLSITRQAVQMRLAGAGVGYIETALSAFRQHNYQQDAT